MWGDILARTMGHDACTGGCVPCPSLPYQKETSDGNENNKQLPAESVRPAPAERKTNVLPWP